MASRAIRVVAILLGATGFVLFLSNRPPKTLSSKAKAMIGRRIALRVSLSKIDLQICAGTNLYMCHARSRQGGLLLLRERRLVCGLLEP